MSDAMHWTDRLSDYLDDELTPAERTAAERHLAGCPACAGLLVELREVVASARALPDEPPVRDLWPAIGARLRPRSPTAGQPDGRVPVRSLVPRLARRRVVLSVPQLAAAGLALAIVSAGGAWAALTLGTSTFDATTHVVRAPDLVPAVLAAYEPAMASLEDEYRARRDELEPETVLVIERNLATIDQAIREAREALAADPSSGFLNTHLAEAMRRRMNLLREATSI